MKHTQLPLDEHDHRREVVRVHLLAHEEGVPYEVEELPCAACDAALEEGEARAGCLKSEVDDEEAEF